MQTNESLSRRHFLRAATLATATAPFVGLDLGYGLAGASMALDRYQRFRVGVTAKVYRAHTNGEPLGNLTATRTLDRWVNLFADFTIGF